MAKFLKDLLYRLQNAKLRTCKMLYSCRFDGVELWSRSLVGLFVLREGTMCWVLCCVGNDWSVDHTNGGGYNQTTIKPTNQLNNKPTRQINNQSNNQPTNQPAIQPTKKTTNQPTNKKPIIRPTNQQAKQTSKHPTNKQNSQLINQPTNQTISQPTNNQTASQPN